MVACVDFIVGMGNRMVTSEIREFHGIFSKIKFPKPLSNEELLDEVEQNICSFDQLKM